MKIFVGNLGTETTEKELETLFSGIGPIKSVKIINDNYTSRSRGFGFVEMEEAEHAQKAIETLNSTVLNGQTIVVNEAKPKADNSNTGFNKRY